MLLLKKIIGVLLLPFCVGFFNSFLSELASVHTVGYAEGFFLAGLIIYPLIHYLMFKPSFLSTFAHEITHALWGLLFRAKIRDMGVKGETGFVNMTKNNDFIRLSPYVFPLYTFSVLVAYLFVRPEYYMWLTFALGLTLSNHLIHTYETLSVRQPDIHKTGVIFSLPLIFLVNLTVIVFILNFVSASNINMIRFFLNGIYGTYSLVSGVIV